jgi:hypothetical protein
VSLLHRRRRGDALHRRRPAGVVPDRGRGPLRRAGLLRLPTDPTARVGGGAADTGPRPPPCAPTAAAARSLTHRRDRGAHGRAQALGGRDLQVVPAVPAAKCCAGGVPVVSQERRQRQQRSEDVAASPANNCSLNERKLVPPVVDWPLGCSFKCDRLSRLPLGRCSIAVAFLRGAVRGGCEELAQGKYSGDLDRLGVRRRGLLRKRGYGDGCAAAGFLNGTCPMAPLRARIRKPIPLSSRAMPTTIPNREIALPA